MTRKFLHIVMVFLPFLPVYPLMAAETQQSVASLSISRDECAMLAKQAARQSADYVPGMAANGKRVASANVDNKADDYLPDTFIIPLTASLANLIGLSDAQKAVLGDGVSVGTVSVSRGGTVKLNGRRIGGPSDSAQLWQALCR